MEAHRHPCMNRSDKYHGIPDTVWEQAIDHPIGYYKSKRTIPKASVRRCCTKKYLEQLYTLDADVDALIGPNIHQMLRSNLYEGTSLTQLGEVHGVTKQTISNWLYGSKSSVYSKLRWRVSRL